MARTKKPTKYKRGSESLASQIVKQPKFIRDNLIGKRFGRLLVIQVLGSNARRQIVYQCSCDCGKYVNLNGDAIRNAHVRSCGCITNERLRQDQINARVLKSTRDKCISDFYIQYKCNARHRNKDFALTRIQIESLIFLECFYCGRSPQTPYKNKAKKDETIFHNGIDRYDNSIGYRLENCVTCCSICNLMKMDYTVDEFYNQIDLIYENKKKQTRKI